MVAGVKTVELKRGSKGETMEVNETEAQGFEDNGWKRTGRAWDDQRRELDPKSGRPLSEIEAEAEGKADAKDATKGMTKAEREAYEKENNPDSSKPVTGPSARYEEPEDSRAGKGVDYKDREPMYQPRRSGVSGGEPQPTKDNLSKAEEE